MNNQTTDFENLSGLRKIYHSWGPLVLLVLALFALRWTFIEPYVVPTGSMEPTLKPGDRLYALKCAYDVRLPFTDIVLFKTGQVKRGDVILFKSPRNPAITFVKRAVAIAGDKIAFRQGQLILNGKEMPVQLAPDRSVMDDLEEAPNRVLYIENLDGVKHYKVLHQYDFLIRNMEERLIPEGYVFAVGDNRDNSSDSRVWGLVPMENLKGEAMFIWFSSHHVNGAPMSMNLKWALTRPRGERVGTIIR